MERGELQLRNLHKSYGPAKALDGLSLTVGAGELVVLLGPSGCGKSTALRAVAGLEALESGSISVNSQDISRLKAAKRNMGMVFQNYSLFPHQSARENIEFGLKIRKVASSKRRERASELLELVGLQDFGDRLPHQLSGGQQQRIALARALAIEPSVLLLDEPLSALDAKVRVALREEIRRIQREVGIATLFVTHDQEEALAVADQIGVMRAGRIEQFGSPVEIYTSPATEFVADFVGRVNRIGGTVLSESVVEIPGVGQLSANTDLAPGTRVNVLIRPEQLGIRENPEGSLRITELGFMGSSFQARIAGEGELSLSVTISPEEALGIGIGIPIDLFQRGPVLLTLPSNETGFAPLAQLD